VAATSQGGLQVFGAMSYIVAHDIFGVPISLYDWLIVLPVFLGSLTCVLFYFLVRKIAGDAAGLFAALIFAVSPPIIERGNLGWFKSEPLAILLFVAASYLMLTVFDKDRPLRGRILRSLAGGLLIGYGNTAWGGGDYFSAAFGLIFMLIPFLNLDLAAYTPAMISFTASTLLMSAVFPRPGPAIVTNPVGLVMIGGTLFALVAQWAKTWVKPTEYRTTLFKLIFAFGLGGLALLSFGLVGGLTLRYLTVLDPGLRTGNALVQSVAEQQLPTGADYFTSYAIVMCFAMAGALVAFRRKGFVMIFALVFGLTGLYFSASFSRLLVYSSISLGILGGIGFAELVYAIVKPGSTQLVKKAKQAPTSRNEMKVVFSVAVIALLVLPAGSYWIPNPIQCTYGGQLFCNNSPADSGVSLVNGATIYSRYAFNDWIDALQWVRQDTPTNAVIISWWDYGYWFTVMGNRTTVVDNATLNSTRIAQVGQLLMSNATQAATMAESMGGGRPTYVAIFITGSIYPYTDQSTGTTTNYFVLQVPSGNGFTAGGGDESKKQWFIRIGGLDETKYLECPGLATNEVASSGAACESVDDFNLTPYAMTNSLFGQLLPFSLAGYLYSSGSGSSATIQFTTSYQFSSNGAPPLEVFNYPSTFNFGSNSTGPFRLAYVSPSLANAVNGDSACPGNSQLQCFNTVLIYQLVQ
jgi:dolichyl-diphosphooligosaccharide---protein glycosyltransferase